MAHSVFRVKKKEHKKRRRSRRIHLGDIIERDLKCDVQCMSKLVHVLWKRFSCCTYPSKFVRELSLYKNTNVNNTFLYMAYCWRSFERVDCSSYSSGLESSLVNGGWNVKLKCLVHTLIQGLLLEFIRQGGLYSLNSSGLRLSLAVDAKYNGLRVGCFLSVLMQLVNFRLDLNARRDFIS